MDHHATRAELCFLNVTLWDFTWHSMGESQIDQVMAEGGEILYDVEPLRVVSHFSIRGERFQPHGAFCLWECLGSPLIGRLAEGWRSHRATIDERTGVMRHYRLSADEVGTLHVVCTGVEIG